MSVDFSDCSFHIKAKILEENCCTRRDEDAGEIGRGFVKNKKKHVLLYTD